MKKYILLLLPLFAFSVAGCKKTKLEGDLEPLAGEWSWVKTVGSCGSSDPNWCYYTPDIREQSVTVNFKEQGRFEYFEGDERVASGRMQAEYHDPDWAIPTWAYFVELKPSLGSKLDEKQLSCYFLKDTLILNHYPYSMSAVKNYFVPAN